MVPAEGAQLAGSQAIRLVSGAQARKALVQRLADGLSAVFVPSRLRYRRGHPDWVAAAGQSADAVSAAAVAVLIIAAAPPSPSGQPTRHRRSPGMPRANVELLCQVPVIADSEPADVSTARRWYAGIDAAADGRSLRLPSSGTSVASARREAGADLVHVDLAGLGGQLLERLLGQRARLRRAR